MAVCGRAAPRTSRLRSREASTRSSPALTRPLPQFGAAGATLQATIGYDGEGTTTVEGTFELDGPSIDIDRTEEGDGPSRAWVGRGASGTFLAAASGLSVSATVTDSRRRHAHRTVRIHP